jgi:hypothetical protein
MKHKTKNISIYLAASLMWGVVIGYTFVGTVLSTRGREEQLEMRGHHSAR